MSDENIFDWWLMNGAVFGTDVAMRLPFRPLRFVGFIVIGLPWFLVTLPITFVASICAVVVGVWEATR